MRGLIVRMLIGAAALTVGGCDDGGRYPRYYGGPYYDPCQRFSSCEQCTPIVGCGWCSYGQGQGVCLDEPNDCRTEEFSWTWDPAGCGADAGAAAIDAATE